MQALFGLIRLPFALVGFAIHTVAVILVSMLLPLYFAAPNVWWLACAPFVVVFAALMGDESMVKDHFRNWREWNHDTWRTYRSWVPGRYAELAKWVESGE